MEDLKFPIPYYKEINEFFQSIPFDYRTNDPNLFCLRMLENEGPTNNYKPPFRKDFYFIKNTQLLRRKNSKDRLSVNNLPFFPIFIPCTIEVMALPLYHVKFKLK